MDIDGDEDDEQDFYDTCMENEYLVSRYKLYDSPEGFLARRDKIYARSRALNCHDSSVWLTYSTDVDGCVVELKSITGFLGCVRHVTVCPKDSFSMRNVQHVLKKHVDVGKYSKAELTSFNSSLGFQLFYADGWECWIGLIPRPQREKVSMSTEQIRQISYNVFMGLRLRMQKVLWEYAQSGKASRTLAKNDINDIGKLFVLPDDRVAILEAIQVALVGLDEKGFRPIVFCFRFGEKMSNGLDMTVFDKILIKKVTVHAAANIQTDCNIDLMWSTTGIMTVIGNRGTLGCCLSYRDCSNYQSNLDGRCLDIKPELRRVCYFPDNLTFIQLYADVPHRKPKSRFHPVSGLIAGGLCFAKSTLEAFKRDSTNYVSALDSNLTLLCESSCRIEVVCELHEVADVIHAEEVVNLHELDLLLQSRPLLVPFPRSVLLSVREIGLFLSAQLQQLLDKYQSTGNVEATWRAFQFELAAEKLLWGRPLCHMSDRYAVNLGPGLLVTGRSATDDLGFLALDDWSACLYNEDSIPLYSIWTRSEGVGKGMIRAAGLHDHIEGGFHIIGRRLVQALLGDLYEGGSARTIMRFSEMLLELKSDKPRYRTTGAIRLQSLCELLAAPRRTPPQMVYPSLVRLLQKASLPVKEVLEAGIKDMELTYFPAFQTHDKHGNATLSWSFPLNLWPIVYSGICQTKSLSLAVYHDLVKGELERRNLLFVSKLKKISGIFPWLACCLLKLEREGLDEEKTIKTLCFISCIAFVMQGWFIDYDRLSVLTSELPVHQQKLKALEILSKFQLGTVNTNASKLFRLHQSIPHKLLCREPAGVVREESNTANQVQRMEVPPVDRPESVPAADADEGVSISSQNVVHRNSFCKPAFANVLKKAWSSEEIEIFAEVINLKCGKTTAQLYDIFREKCLKEGISFRSLTAFRKKYQRNCPR